METRDAKVLRLIFLSQALCLDPAYDTVEEQEEAKKEIIILSNELHVTPPHRGESVLSIVRRLSSILLEEASSD